MTLVENRTQRIITLCGLYVAQGVPWGFMLLTLPNFLADKYNVGDTDIGKLVAIILVPWSFKLIWAPLMDSFTIRSMGRRRPWIIGAEVMMAVTLLGFMGLGDPSEKLKYILFMYFLHNCFASLQDVCTDALAIDILPANEQGKMNGLMWGSKLIGKGVGAWGLSHVLAWGGLEACVAVQIGVLLLIMLIPVLILERPGEKRFPWSQGSASIPKAEQRRSPMVVLKSIGRAFLLPTTAVFVFFTLSKLIGPGINEVITKGLYTQHLDPGWTHVELTRVQGLYSTPLIILGAFGGGFLADRFGRRLILLAGFGGYALAAVTFAIAQPLWNEPWFSTGYLLTYETLNAVGSVGFLSMAMRISWTAAAATVFTTYMTLSNVSHVMGNWIAGPVREALVFERFGADAILNSYRLTFFVVAAISVLPLILLFWVQPAEVDRAKRREMAS